ncbi:hypothetical protein NA78x_000545 [Anatilimnocola sp. NA78]|uniref:hypothetical protein n=1 Tax=Anatilimnocola sp. NA78 TaxID=3415683 RepID=UPI003CE5C167
MYGVPADLDLSFLIGCELTQVCFGCHQIQLHFHPTASISIEGKWELRDIAGKRIDGESKAGEGMDSASHLVRLLGQRVAGVVISAPQSIAIRLGDEAVLHLFDNQPAHESFQIQPGNIIV